MKPLLGIDFGTSSARAALVTGRDVKVVLHAGGNTAIPSVVVFPPAAFGGGPPLVGAAAAEVTTHHPERAITAVKRLLGRKLEAPEVRHHRQTATYDLVGAKNGDARVRVGRRHHPPQDIAAYILDALRSSAQRQAGGLVTDAVLAVPTMFDDVQRQAIRDAARIAGLNVLGLVTETSAAVLGSTVYPGPRGDDRKVLVYDLGAGSFAVAALLVNERGAEVVATGGDAFLGGEDFDQRIVTFVCEEVLKEGGADLRRDRALLARLKLVAERMKVELSTSRSVDIELPAAPGRAPGIVRLDRARFETLTQDLVDRTVWACESVLRDAKWSAAEVDVLLLVGGQTRMPRIRVQLDELCGKAPLEIQSPELIVAAGAARRAVSIVGGGSWRARDKVFLTEITCLSLGLESAGGLFARLVPRGTPLPAARTQIFSTAADGQSQILIHLLQGEREMAADNESLARIYIGPLSSRPRGEIQVEVAITTDGGGLPSATARALPGGEVKQVRLRPSVGLTEAEVAALAAVHAGGPAAAAAVALTADVADTAPDGLDVGEPEHELSLAPAIDPTAHGG